MESQELRVGVCSCVDDYRGQFQGSEVTIPNSPLVFILREVIISERKQHLSIRANRPHLFLDSHPVGGKYQSDLNIVQLISSQGREDGVYMGIGMTHGHGSIDRFRREWTGVKKPSSEEILITIPELLASIKTEKFDLWLSRMTPPGWTLPEQKAFSSTVCAT